jgi:hypothetical protein
MKSAFVLCVMLFAAGREACADFQTSGYLDPNAFDPSLPDWAQRVGFDLGPPQGFPSEHTNVILADFTLNAIGSITIESFGFAANGVDPYVALFAGSTASLGATAFELEQSPGGDFSFATPVLTSGDYVLAISAWNNYACPFGLVGCTLADGFSGLANLPSGHDTFFDIRVLGDVTPGDSTPIPEPSHFLFVVIGVTVALSRKRLGKAR